MTTLPDFEEWAENVWRDHSKVEESLRSAFEQGYHLGKRHQLEMLKEDMLYNSGAEE